MGHHLFIHEKKSLAMRDFDVALVRHFLIAGASLVGDESLSNEITSWEYQGPGVWVGIDETVLIGQRAIFAAGVEVAEKIGDELTVDYLSRNVQLRGGRWLKPQRTSDVVTLIRGLDEHLHGRT
jgi:hypothetical protein